MVTVKEKLLRFFTGKMSKTIYISIAAAVVCGAVVITSTVIVHNNNQKIDSVLESLSASESVSELSSVSATESVSDTDNTELQTQAKASNNQQVEDRKQQYEAEYAKLTTEHHKKQRELQEEYDANRPQYAIMPEPRERRLETEEEYAQYLKEYEIERQRREKENSQREETLKRITEQIHALDAQYEKDVTALKARYGIA